MIKSKLHIINIIIKNTNNKRRSAREKTKEGQII